MAAAGIKNWMLWGVRVVFVIAGLGIWFGTQKMISLRPEHVGIGDRVLDLLAPVHGWLSADGMRWRALLVVSSLVIDATAVWMLLNTIFGKSVRPFVGLVMLFGLRQIMQGICVVPSPEGMIWEHPGVPSLLVTYGVSNDMFFSGHTALAVFGAVELARLGRKWIGVGVAVAVFEVLAVLSLRAHWTMDVFAGAVTALLVAVVAGRVARPVDGWMGRTFGNSVS